MRLSPRAKAALDTVRVVVVAILMVMGLLGAAAMWLYLRIGA